MHLTEHVKKERSALDSLSPHAVVRMTPNIAVLEPEDMLFNPRRRLDRHLIDALDNLRFELISAKSRWKAPNRIDTCGLEYLQLGCGEDLIDDFLNTDHPINKKADAAVDARFLLPFDDNAWRGVYAHHVVEHLDYEDGCRLFREVKRVLIPGGVFRMVVPDLEIFLRLYSSDDTGRIFRLYPPWAMKELTVKTPLEMVDYIFRDQKFNQHLSSWDFTTAALHLHETGFSKVIRQSVNASLDAKLTGHDKGDWESFSLYVEAVK
jgi:predicted SAM-dependent methyltransferase